MMPLCYVTNNLTNVLICVNTILFTLLGPYMFQPSTGHPQVVLIPFCEQNRHNTCPDVIIILKNSLLMAETCRGVAV